MKRLLLLAVCFSMLIGSAMAQRKVTGKVTSSDDSLGLPGVTVREKGTDNGVTTDLDGNFSLSVQDGATLVFSFVGYVTQEVAVGARSVVDITLEPDVTELSEVVVTALGISREESSLGYAVQEVDGDKVNMVGESNVVSSLSGKVAGVQIISSSGANLGGSTKVRLRGMTTLGESQPLFVIDGTPISNESFSPSGRTHYAGGGRDYGNLAADINPNDIETISVLKGPSAAALYGQRGANGVVIITTKKGKRGQGIGVDINSNTTFDKVYVLPEYQNQYGGGYTQNMGTFNYVAGVHPAEWAVLDGQPMPNYAADESWGPALDGRQAIHWDAWFPGHDDYLTTRPWSPNADNVRNFFNTGVSLNNNVALSGGNDDVKARLSLGNIRQSGVMPNSSLNKVNASLNVTANLSEKLTLSSQMMYVNTKGFGRPALGYSGGPVSSFNQWFQRQIDIDRLAIYENPDGTQRFWNIRGGDIAGGRQPGQPLYWDNPYWDLYKNTSEDERDRFLGNVSLRYQITEDLAITGVARRDGYTQRIEERTAFGGLNLPSYTYQLIQGQENNWEFLTEYGKNFGDVSLNANFGGNIRQNWYTRSFQSTNGGLSVDGFYDIDASIDRPTGDDTYRQRKEVRSFYGSASFGFRDFLYVDVTGRQDWSSSLPVAENGYFYPSVSSSFVFSELIDVPAISFGKVRASIAQVGSDIGPYQIYPTYGIGAPYGQLASLSVPNTLPNEDLVPQTSTNMEAGLNMNFFNSRVRFDLAVYRNTVENQILNLTVPGSSGYSSALVNAGSIQSQGVELSLSGTPIQGDLTWDIDFNLARNRSTVLALAEGLENRELQLALSDGWGGLRLNARVGEEWGQLTGGGFQYFQATDANGNPIDHENNGQRVVTGNGTFAYEGNKDLGSILPDFTGGLRNTFSFGSFDASAFIDYQIGGQFFSITKMFNAYSGLGIETVANNDLGNNLRDPLLDASGNVIVDGDGDPVSSAPAEQVGPNSGGVRVEGVDANGNPVAYYTSGITYYGGLFGLNENWLYDATYIKLREVRIGYSLPSDLVSRIGLTSANVAVVGRNLWLIHTNVEGIDPSEIGEGAGGFNVAEGGVLPGVRSLGFNIKLGL